MEKNCVSVVTITFNNYDELLLTLKSLEKASHFESVIINGGKCEKTKSYIVEHGLKGVSEPDEGISDAFNKGIKYSESAYIAFLNSGDELLDGQYYAKAVEIFLQHPDIGFVYADILFSHREHGTLTVKPNPNKGKTPFPHPSLIVRKSIFEKIGGFDKKLKVAMDYDFMQRLLKDGYKGHYYQDAPVVLMDGTGVSSNQGLKGIAEREFILKKYNQITFDSYFYLKTLRVKTYARSILHKLQLLETYDYLKKKIIKIKSE